MDDTEIIALLQNLETDQVERKEALSDPDRVCQAICAFANDLPDHRSAGVIGIGIDDAGAPVGLEVTDDLLLRLAQMRDNGGIYPFPSMTVSRLVIDGAQVAVVVVQPSTSPPVQYKGRTWIRVGPRRATATPEEESRLAERRVNAAVPFDARPLSGASFSAGDLERFSEEVLPQLVAPDILDSNGRTVLQQLAALRLASTDGIPTAAGLLLCSSEPDQWLPGAWTQFLRFRGSTLADPILSEHRISGPLPQAIMEIEEVLRGHIATRVALAGKAVEERVVNVPFEALQQIVRNALIHRTYEATNAPVRVTWFDDRIEVSSPGGPYGLVDAGSFGRPGVTDYRNPTLAGALARMGFVQRFGVGIAIARSQMHRNGNPPPAFQTEPTNVLVILRTVQ